VQVVGYDNIRQAWLIKNSWGPGFADKGFAWVAFDAPSMCDPEDTYGFVFEPYLPPAAALAKLTPAPGRKGCYTYRAVAGEYPEGLASRFGIQVQQLLLDNLDVIKEPSAVPAGTVLTLCGISPAVAGAGQVAAVANPGGSPALNSSGGVNEEVRALMAIKRVLAPVGRGLQDWQLDSPTPCSWTGVVCKEGAQSVTKLLFWRSADQQPLVKLSGKLPSAALLRRLPKLVSISFDSTGVSGTLPADWSQLTQLRVAALSGNALEGEGAGDRRQHPGRQLGLGWPQWLCQRRITFTSTAP
jgi:hypothetical protein